MRELDRDELVKISAGLHLNLGAVIAAIATGVVTGGPAGLGIALCSIVISEGVNNLNDLRDK